MSQGISRYVAAFADLNADRHQEAIVYITDAAWCGSGGCVLLILTPQLDSWRVVTKLTISRPPIRVLQSTSHGWRDLSVQVSGGGIPRAYDAWLKFDGASYPPNPTVPPALRVSKQSVGQLLIGPEAVKRSFGK